MAFPLLIAVLASSVPPGDGQARGIVQVSLEVVAVCRVSVETEHAEGRGSDRPTIDCPGRVPRSLTVIEPPKQESIFVRVSFSEAYAVPAPRIVAVDF